MKEKRKVSLNMEMEFDFPELQIAKAASNRLLLKVFPQTESFSLTPAGIAAAGSLSYIQAALFQAAKQIGNDLFSFH